MTLLAFILLMMASAGAQASAWWPQSPHIAAKSWVLLDARSGQVLASDNENMELPPASLTKMMTLYLAFEDLKLGRIKMSDPVPVSVKAWKMGGSRMFIDPSKHPTVEQLLHGISTDSGNDAVIALAEYISGTESAFVSRMNDKAKELGMTHTHFADATGYPTSDHYSTALDMAHLGAALWRDFPEYYPLFDEHSYTYDNITQSNRNRLLWRDPRVDGIKTGHTDAAGFCLVTSAQKGDTRFVTAVFGTDSDDARAQQSKAILDFAFRNFVTMRPAEHDIRRQVEVYDGKQNSVWLVPQQPMWISVPRGFEKYVKFHLRYQAPLRAPIAKGQVLGTIEAVAKMPNDDKAEVLGSVSMEADGPVALASWFGRKWDALRLWWQSSDKAAQAKE
ncbi:MAG TPA: D-alanyl-D-alanine carboxypeptidase family protein [Mariprofundaceae bacterium]|nr:D-alanyl-D-alanine carboxypeptidase family protein [Mariprofundaceae bacterium]